MDFYNRESEFTLLERLYHQSKTVSKMAVIMGRRRVGKTELCLHFGQKKSPFLYLFVSRKSEPLLCAEFLEEIQKVFKIPVIGEIKKFQDIFLFLLTFSQKEHLTLVIDEFQEFYHVNSDVYSELQRLWDLHKRNSHLLCIFVGSVYSLMHKIFEGSKEPLFGRADTLFILKPLSIKTLHQILGDHKVTSTKTLFDYYTVTGGLPKYVEWLIENKIFSFEAMTRFMTEPTSSWLHEGKVLLIEEFGKEYSHYFSILELLASGKTSRSEIESILEKNIGGYLERLENDYTLVKRVRSIHAKPGSKAQKFKITDNFLAFWFCFFYRHRTAIEMGNLQFINQVLQQGYTNYSGRMLETFFKNLFADTHRYNQIGSYWDNKGQNEIDLVAINTIEKHIVLGEIKLNPYKINLNLLKQKSKGLLQHYEGYTVEYMGLSLEDIQKFL